MINLYTDTKIYVHCPAGTVTGGAELLHQLVSLLRDFGRNAFVVYYGKGEHSIPSDYQKYNVKIAQSIEDNDVNIEVFNEGNFNLISQNHTQKFLWWISVDNFFVYARDYLPLSELFFINKKWWLGTFINRIKRLCAGENKFIHTLSIADLKHMNATCGYQAEYIQHFLLKQGFKEIVALKDYINTEHFQPFEIEGRKDIVLYNPRKGWKFTKRLIEAAPDIVWVPLTGMSRKELVQTMKNAKVYIDFGNHPGKDRLPRECAMNGCCIITGLKGSAGFFEDVPIDEKYKFDEKHTSIRQIENRIRWTLANYEQAINDFEYYRNIIRQDKSEFERQVHSLFQC